MNKFVLLLILSMSTALAQPAIPAPPAPPAPPASTMPPQPPMPPAPPAAGPRRPPLERAFHIGVPGRWWHDPRMVQKLALTADQQRKMDDIFQQHRLRLIDLNAALQREEAIMEPLVEAEQPDETKIVAQIDRVAQSRAELEKSNARMLLGIRRVLTPEQWKKLQTDRPGAEIPKPAPVPKRRAE